jgi:Xaa-Pro aminopeptidase
MRYHSIDKTFFIENRQKLASLLKPGSVAIIFSNYQMPRNGDQYFPYRQQSDFFFLTGIEQAKSILILAPDAPLNEQKEVLFILKSNPSLEIWEGHKLTLNEAALISGIKTVKYAEELDTFLQALVIRLENVYFNIPELPKFLPEVRVWDEVFALQFKEKFPLHKYERLAPLMQQLRLIKSAIELELIKTAINITKNSFIKVLTYLKPGMKEYELEGVITREFIQEGASGHAYAPIVASGKNACILHYIENDSECQEGDLLLMDFGAEYANYAADMSRTIPVNGKFSKRQLEIYEAVMRIYFEARKLMKPGTSINKIHAEVCKYSEEEHIRLGLYTHDDSKKNTGENPLWYNYYMHGTSHFLGLDVHDVGTKETILEPGMVLTCEPGIYIANEGIGIRLENNLLITKDGNDDLMAEIPMKAEEIESIMQKR